ncbi:SLC25A37 [Cordylochernes scorpioides]|uniref:SLC25A37 n=1 Tax=Cordylochernes scorpioides TaxID=51811 RepID=A0ABY6K0G1_9ARAC|nr:SLC25A37 [Cordylochernes scorpioides]
MQSLQPVPGSQYRSVHEALYKMVRHEGVLRPLKGINAMVAGAGPAHALYFSCYEKMKRVLSGTEHGHNNPLAHVIKQRLQVYNTPYKGVLDCFWRVLNTEGPRAFFRSYTTQMTMNIPFQSIHFMSYEFMQNQTNPERLFNPKAHIVSGAIAGAFAAAITTPLDVCKTLLNTQEQRTLTMANRPNINGLVTAFTTIYRIGGVSGYFRGLQARVMYQMPATAISWAVYEFFKHFFQHKNDPND